MIESIEYDENEIVVDGGDNFAKLEALGDPLSQGGVCRVGYVLCLLLVSENDKDSSYDSKIICQHYHKR